MNLERTQTMMIVRCMHTQKNLALEVSLTYLGIAS